MIIFIQNLAELNSDQKQIIHNRTYLLNNIHYIDKFEKISVIMICIGYGNKETLIVSGGVELKAVLDTIATRRFRNVLSESIVLINTLMGLDTCH